mmetsp:Transcript_115772/g.236684  ORF Transcript_115772/g.236684 Transcript_115772/m.236684 type:complete len:113 (+) Transcript_115772:224-562(+)
MNISDHNPPSCWSLSPTTTTFTQMKATTTLFTTTITMTMTENDFPMQVDTTEDRPPQPDFSSTHFNELKREKIHPGEKIATALLILLRFWFLSFFAWMESVWTRTENSISRL